MADNEGSGEKEDAPPVQSADFYVEGSEECDAQSQFSETCSVQDGEVSFSRAVGRVT